MLARAALGAAVLLPAGCMVGPRYKPPAPPPPPAAYKEQPAPSVPTGDWTPATPSDAMLRGKWWLVFNQPELNDLEDQLNVNNQNIRESFENFMEARALVREARAQYFPTVGIDPAYARSRTSVNQRSNPLGASGPTVGGNPSSSQETSLINLPLDVSWEPDLWGRIRNTVRQSQYSAQMSAADLENERLTEQASLAQYFFELRGQDQLQKILDDTVVADQKALELAKSRYEAGVDDQISVVEAQTTLDSARSAATNVGVARAQFEHAIALLVGKPAGGFTMAVLGMTAAPPPIPAGLPSQLLERRPDIASAERNLAAANAQIGIATAAYYPDLTLSASGGFESATLKHLFDWPSRFWSVGPSFSETLYDGGLRRATVQQYEATYNARVAAYRQTVLTGFQQVEDALASVRILSQQIEQQRHAVDSSRTFLELELNRYETGIDPYLNVLTAQTTLLGNQETLNNLEVQRMTAAVQLIEALGGGWDRSQLPTPQQVTQKLTRPDTALDH